jgi:pilus assembly protein CpaB
VRSRLLTITLAAVLGLLGVVAILAYVRQANERAVDGLKAETVLVAKGPIPAGTLLSKAQADQLLSTEKVPDSSVTDAVQSVTAVNAVEAFTGPVATGQVVLANMLGPASSVTANSGLGVPKDMVAVTINMCVSEAVSGYVTPGSYVAVFDTVVNDAANPVSRSCDTGHQALGSSIGDANVATTLLVLERAQVLAVGPSAGSTSSSSVAQATEQASAASSSSGEVLVTLAVDQADAERVILLDEVGLPYMALLGPSPSSYTPSFAGPVALFQQ